MGAHKKRQKLSDGTAVAVSNSDEQVAHDNDTSKLKTKSSNSLSSSLYVRGLPASSTNESIAEYFSQSFPVKHAVAVIDKETHLCKGFGFVTFADHEDAQRALNEFHGKELEGKKLNISFADRRQRDENGVPGEADAQAQAEAQQPQSSKLIVRNLPWSVNTPEKLSRLFLSFGKINQAIVPKDHHDKMKGFGIIMLRGRKNAELALERMNGKEVDGRTLAVDWAADRDTWNKAQAESRAKEAEEKKGQKAIEKKDAQDDTARVDSGQSDDEELGDGNDDNSSVGEDVESDVDEDMDVEDNEDDDDEDARLQKAPKLTSNEATLFIRNLPFTASDEDVYEHFEEFGPVRYARIVIDHSTERPRGTGFVCFRSKDDADACVKGAPKLTEPMSNKGKKDAATTGPSILENELADPSGRYTMDGRVLQLTRAVEKSEADRLAAEGVASRSKRDRDKRRMYLLGEGTIPSNSPFYAKLSASEIAMREASVKQRKKLLETNPSLNLSLTRLSIRNIPRNVTSKDLRALARQAIVEFAKDVKAGKRQPLSKEEQSRAAEEMKEAEKERKQKGSGVVRQAKIVYEGSEGGKVEEGAGRSRGYGFVEYYTHRSALMGLRWLNGHSIEYQAMETKKKATKEDIQDRKKRLIVEFAIENAQVVKRRKEKEAKSREVPKGANSSVAPKNATTDAAMPKSARDKKRKRDEVTEDIPTSAKKSKGTGPSAGEARMQHDAKRVKERKIIASKKHEKRALRKQARATKA